MHHLPTGRHQFESHVVMTLTFKIFKMIFTRSGTYSGGRYKRGRSTKLPLDHPKRASICRFRLVDCQDI